MKFIFEVKDSRLFLFITLFLYKIIISQCTDGFTTNIDIASWIDQSNQEDLRHLDNFLDNLRLQNNPNLMPLLVNNDTNLNTHTQRFGWESLALFIGLTIGGYIVIRYGSDILQGLKSLFNEVTMTVINISRESVRNKAIELARNPENYQRIIAYIQLRSQYSA